MGITLTGVCVLMVFPPVREQTGKQTESARPRFRGQADEEP